MNMTLQNAGALALAPDEGERLFWLGEPAILKVTGAETGGQLRRRRGRLDARGLRAAPRARQ